MVQRLAGGLTEGGHNTPAPRHGGQLQVFDVSILCSTQHHLHFSPGRLPGHLGWVWRWGGQQPYDSWRVEGDCCKLLQPMEFSPWMANTFAYCVLPMEGPSSTTIRGTIVLLALVVANCRFTWVQVGAPGTASDAQLWNESTLRDAFITNFIDIPQQEPLTGEDRPIPHFIIGDNAFALNNGWWSRSMQHLWNRTSGSSIIAFLAPDDALRMPLAYWPITGTAYSQPFDKSRRM